MPTVTGKAAVSSYFRSLPAKIEALARGAARAGGTVIADEIKERTPSQDVRDGLRMKSTIDAGQVTVTIDLKPGWARAVGNWLEYGTSGHFISVDDSQRRGKGLRRINAQVKENGGDASLVIGGKFVGATVWHPGARRIPAFRPAIDTKEAEAIAAAQAYINTRVRRGDFGEDSE